MALQGICKKACYVKYFQGVYAHIYHVLASAQGGHGAVGSLNGPTSINGPAGPYSNVPGSGDQSGAVPAKMLSHALASSLGLDPNLLQQMIDGNLSLMPHYKALFLPATIYSCLPCF